jgi:uncharacterized protein YndB with AHSA1/START domain
MRRDLRFVVEYRHSPEKVWNALTDASAIAVWLMQNDFAPRVGHHFKLRAKPMPGWDGVVHCEVLELTPPRRMVWSWKSNAPLDTKVVFTLEPTSSGTRLQLDHLGFRGLKGVMISAILGSGWKGILNQGLAGVLDGNLTPGACQSQAAV